MALNERIMLVNSAAAGIVQAADRELLWNWARRALGGDRRHEAGISLTSGPVVVIRCEPVLDGPRVVGALTQVVASSTGELGASRWAGETGATSHGWSSLTETERTLAELVAQGLTNREAAARLYLSPHTVDFHLRHVFGKLDVRSRVELARAVLERQAEASRC